MTRREEFLGEVNPGFNLWTSAHGFHHLTLSNRKGWVIMWAVLLTILVGTLSGLLIYYLHYVFTDASYSKVSFESPASWDWPSTVVCDNQASILSWSLGATMCKHDVNEYWYQNYEKSLNTTLSKDKYKGSLELLMKDISPKCTEFVLECKLGNTILNGSTCCSQFFNPEPIIGRHGTCFSSRQGSERYQVRKAGEAGAVTITLMTESGNALDQNYISNELIARGKGVTFAIINDFVGLDAALTTQGQSVQQGKCTQMGAKDVDADFRMGVETSLGFSRHSCQTTAKTEILSRSLLGCTFASEDKKYKRCHPAQSASFYKSFINKGAKLKVPEVNLDSHKDVKERYEKGCPKECSQERFTMSASYSPISQKLLGQINTQLGKIGQSGSKASVLKFFVNSLEYEEVRNFPQHGLQFLAEVGGLMALFLGVSIVSVVECICYAGFKASTYCCEPNYVDDEDDFEPKAWNHPQQNDSPRSASFDRQPHGRVRHTPNAQNLGFTRN